MQRLGGLTRFLGECGKRVTPMTPTGTDQERDQAEAGELRVYVPTQAALGWGTRKVHRLRRVYVPPKRSLDGAPKRSWGELSLRDKSHELAFEGEFFVGEVAVAGDDQRVQDAGEEGCVGVGDGDALE